MKIATISSIAFVASGCVYSARRSLVTLSLTVFTLRDTKTHINISNGSDILSNIETVVDDSLSFRTTL